MRLLRIIISRQVMCMVARFKKQVRAHERAYMRMIKSLERLARQLQRILRAAQIHAVVTPIIESDWLKHAPCGALEITVLFYSDDCNIPLRTVLRELCNEHQLFTNWGYFPIITTAKINEEQRKRLREIFSTKESE